MDFHREHRDVLTNRTFEILTFVNFESTQLQSMRIFPVILHTTNCRMQTNRTMNIINNENLIYCYTLCLRLPPNKAAPSLLLIVIRTGVCQQIGPPLILI